MKKTNTIKDKITRCAKKIRRVSFRNVIDVSEFKDWKNHVEHIVWQLVGFFLLIILYVGFGEKFHEFCIQHVSKVYMPIKNSFNSSLFASLSLVFTVFVILGLYVYRRLKDKVASPKRVLVFSFVEYVFYSWKLFDATYVCDKFSFYHVGLIVIAACILCELCKCLPRIERKNFTGNKGFTTDKIIKNEEFVNPIRAKYAQAVFDKLIETDVHEEAYALAIVGHWGSGKSSFMNMLRQKVCAAQYDFFDFNPWTTFSESSVDKIFIDSLKEFLQAHSISAVKQLSKYAKAISTVRGNLQIVPAVVDPLVESADSVGSIKKEIISKLSLFPKPIFIFIDDLDRMKEKEIFEVFKLIRNTFNFPNLIYVVSLDKDYVFEQLQNIGIKDGALFLEKIFPAEIFLPAIDDVDIILTLRDEIMAMVKNKNDILSVFSLLKESEREHIAKILKTYRGAKHFARQFALAFEMARCTLNIEGINYRDLLLLELLKRVNSHIYDVLTYSPENILGEPIVGVDVYNYYVFHENNSSPKMDSATYWLLSALFPGEPMGNRIGNCVYYSQYFSFGVRKLNVSQVKFKDILAASTSISANNGIYKSLRHLLTKPVRVDAKSLYDLFVNYSGNLSSKDSVDRYLLAFFTWMEFETNAIISRALLYIVSCKTYAKKDLQMDIKDSFIEKCQSMLKRTRNNSLVARCLSEVYQKKKTGECILSKDEIKNLLIFNCQQVLNRKTWEPISVVKEDGNELNLVAENSCLYKEIDSNQLMQGKENAVAEYLLSYFQRKRNVGTHLDETLKSISLTTEDLQNEFLYRGSTDLPHAVITIFPDPNFRFDMLKSFLNTCFVPYKNNVKQNQAKVKTKKLI
ncbi:MAG: KAP family NTPase [Bacteroidaceae bacterium]|nr:KAP family NTPase [Bacteroidaceae bacterium]